MRKFAFILMASALVLASCSEKQDPETVSSEATFLLEAGVGSQTELTITFNSDWTVSASDSWYDLSAKSGAAGSTVLTVTANAANEHLAEKESVLYITDGGRTRMFHVIQRGIKGVRAESDEVFVPLEASSARVFLYATETFRVRSESSWMSCATSSFAKTLLSDGRTMSDSVRYALDLNLKDLTEETREGSVTVSPATARAFTLNVTQGEVAPADFTKTFYRHSVLFKFTGTWCTYCPNMAQGVEAALKKLPQRLVPINFYSRSGSMSFPAITDLISTYRITGYPNGVFNTYAWYGSISAEVTENLLTSMSQDAITNYPSKTNISVSTAYANNQLDITVRLAAKEVPSGLKVWVFILENGYVATQSSDNGPIEGYVHDHMARTNVTSLYGDAVTGLTAGSETVLRYSTSLPAEISSANNADVVVLTSYSANTPSQTEFWGEYRNYGTVIDNAAVVPVVNGYVPYTYED